MTIARVYTPAGKIVGHFINPTVDMDPDHYYDISGKFVTEEGTVVEKLEMNPEVLPYTIDISEVKKCPHQSIYHAYVQRGRQPVRMMGSCKLD